MRRFLSQTIVCLLSPMLIAVDSRAICRSERAASSDATIQTSAVLQPVYNGFVKPIRSGLRVLAAALETQDGRAGRVLVASYLAVSMGTPFKIYATSSRGLGMLALLSAAYFSLKVLPLFGLRAERIFFSGFQPGMDAFQHKPRKESGLKRPPIRPSGGLKLDPAMSLREQIQAHAIFNDEVDPQSVLVMGSGRPTVDTQLPIAAVRMSRNWPGIFQNVLAGFLNLMKFSIFIASMSAAIWIWMPLEMYRINAIVKAAVFLGGFLWTLNRLEEADGIRLRKGALYRKTYLEAKLRRKETLHLQTAAILLTTLLVVRNDVNLMPLLIAFKDLFWSAKGQVAAFLSIRPNPQLFSRSA